MMAFSTLAVLQQFLAGTLTAALRSKHKNNRDELVHVISHKLLSNMNPSRNPTPKL